MKRIILWAVLLIFVFSGTAHADLFTRADDFGLGEFTFLVLPIEFPNHPFKPGELDMLETAFNGTSEETGWHSVASYYEESSYGQLALHFEMLPAVCVSRPYPYYEHQYYNYVNYSSGALYPEEHLLKEALTALDGRYSFAEYDANGDQAIDGIYLIYSAPTDEESEDTLWWAWHIYSAIEETFDGLYPDSLVWTGIDTVFEEFNGESIPVNAQCLIHETGHMLGLMDYYDTDYSAPPSGGLGCADMMDDTLGDHCSFSKYMLGWIEPRAVTPETAQYTLSPFSSRGDALILRKSDSRPVWLRNLGDERYGEYLLIDLYTPDGLNQPFADMEGMFSRPGVRIYHVNARANRNEYSYWDPFAYNNSSGERALIRLVEADGDQSIPDTSESEYGGFAKDSDLFHQGDLLQGYTWDDGTPVGYSLSVDLLEDVQAILTLIPEAD